MRIVHYASYEINGQDVYGTAELVNGSGYLFRKDGKRQATLVSYKDVNLLLYGRVDIADTKWAEDCASGDLLALAGTK